MSLICMPLGPDRAALKRETRIGPHCRPLPKLPITAQVSKPRTREAVLGLFPEVGVLDELVQRPPRGKRQEQPIEGDSRKHPRVIEHPSPRQTDDAKPRRSQISDQERRERECFPDLLFPDATEFEKLASPDVSDHQEQEEWMHERRQHCAADKELKCRETAPPKLTAQPQWMAHVNDPSLEPTLEPARPLSQPLR
jgi:hypothetical protein